MNCDKLKSTILQLEVGIEATEDQMAKDPAQNTPSNQTAVAQMKQMLAQDRAQFKSMGCAGGQPEMDQKKYEKYASVCGRVKLQIETDQKLIALADRTLAKLTDSAQIESVKKSRAAYVQDLEKQKKLLVKYGCK